MNVLALLLAAAQIGGPQPQRSDVPPLPSSAAVVQADTPGANLTVYLLTMGPGDQVWEKFGHNAIWVHDAANGTDIAYHWGLFDFADKEFIPRFIQGRMRYSMGAFDMAQTVDAYRQANRTVWAQELNLAPLQRQKLAEFLAWNMLPENRYYRYDYFRDNCSTRVRDALDAALGGVIRGSSERAPSNTTYRFHTARLTQDQASVFTGTMAGLGQPVDRPINAWEEMFLPVRMMNRLREMRVTAATGSEPLVKNERVLVQATRPPEAARVDRGIWGYLLTSGLILLAGFGLWITRWKNGKRAGLLILASIWSLIAGICGTLLFGLWAFTDHLYSYRNENLLQLNPLSLLLAVMLIRVAWKSRSSRRSSQPGTFSRRTAQVAGVIAILSLIGFVIQALPTFNQGNGHLIALVMPLQLGVAALLFSSRDSARSTSRF